MEIKITKRVKLHEVNNDMCHNFYFGVYGQIINDARTRFKRFHFVVWFDIFELFEFLGEEAKKYTKQDLINYVDELSVWYTDLIHSYDNCKEFYEECNRSIDNYNR